MPDISAKLLMEDLTQRQYPGLQQTLREDQFQEAINEAFN